VFLKEQKSFYESALKQADELNYKSIIFGSKTDQSLTKLFLQHLLNHNIEVYGLTKAVTQNGKTFEPEFAYVAPIKQAQFRILQSIFEENETNKYDKSTTFYDISGWSTAQGYGIPYQKSITPIALGTKVIEVPTNNSIVVDNAKLAYALDYQELLAPAALYSLLSKGIIARVAYLPFTTATSKGNQAFNAGTIIIPIAYQQKSAAEVHQILQEVSSQFTVPIHALDNGFSINGIDLGSNNIKVVKKPEIALISGGNWTSFGEIWSLLQDTYNIPVVKIREDNLERVDLNRYTAIVITGSNYSESFAAKLRTWVENGGNLVSLNGSTAWTIKNLFPKPNAKPSESTPASRANSSRFSGVIVKAVLDLQNPIAFGITDSSRFTLKTSLAGLDSSVIQRPILTSTNELNNGYAEKDALDKIKGNIIVGTSAKGRGNVTFFSESPAFRNYWFSSSRLLLNALFFGGNTGNRWF